MSTALITKYRPTQFADCIGNKAAVASLANAVKKQLAHSYLFSGPAGVGKTTMARIAAGELGCGELEEIDAATNTGIDDMRRVIESMNYRPLGGSKKGIIVDECHALSKPALQSLLKSLEEPPAWVYWFLCTTEPGRLLTTTATRLFRVELRGVGPQQMTALLDDIAKKEKMAVTEQVIDVCVDSAQGSVRQALSNLAVCADITNAQDAASLLQAASSSSEAVELARLLVRGASRKEVWAVLEGLRETNPETVRHVVRAYVTKVALNAKNDNAAESALAILEAFAQPFYNADGMAPLVLACGKLVLN